MIVMILNAHIGSDSLVFAKKYYYWLSDRD